MSCCHVVLPTRPRMDKICNLVINIQEDAFLPSGHVSLRSSFLRPSFLSKDDLKETRHMVSCIGPVAAAV